MNQTIKINDTNVVDSNSAMVDKILLFVLYLSLLLTGIFPQSLLSVIVLVAATVLTYHDKPYYVFPAMIFYYSQLDKLAGLSVFRIYTIIFVIILFINHRKKITLNKIHFFILIVYGLYCILTLASYNLQNGIFALFDIVCLLIFTKNFISETSTLNEFFESFSIVAVCAYITGIVTENVMDVSQVIDKTQIDMERYMATFNDPNYMGFFYTIAIFSLICLRLFNKKARIILVVLFYLMLLSTLSVTAIIGNVILWFVFLLVNKKMSFKIWMILLSIVLLIFILFKISEYVEIPMFSHLLMRLESKFDSFLKGDMDSVTTDRTYLTEMHLNYFKSQNLFKILFGGNLVNNIVIDMPMLENSAAHNEYVDLLLNVGVIGCFIIVVYPVIRIIESIKKFRKTRDRNALFTIILKCIWLYYAGTLTLFLDMRFMILYFI